ncbi:lantibiotic dehydratase family protein [Chryseobacterium pennipullorum]|nr:lantibiotic dehydratase family protein [Chryseobacterium pennipullorum]
MKKTTQVTYEDFGHFIIRCPALPYSEHDHFSYETLKENAFFMESLYISSPEFHDEIAKAAVLTEKHKITLLKYWNRIRTRSTPFGMFSGICIGSITEAESKMLISSRYQKVSRLDMSCLSNLVGSLQNRKEVRSALKYFVNDSLYKVGNSHRYYFVKKADNNKDYKFDVVDIEVSGYLNKIIAKAQSGATLSELCSVLGPEFSEEEIYDYLNELIDSQIIICELSLQLTGVPLLSKITKLLDRTALMSVNKKLKETGTLLETQKELITVSKSIENTMRELNIGYNKKELIQVDLKREFQQANLNKALIGDIKDAISYLNSLEDFESENPNLKKFTTTFQQVYEEEEIPLLQALDVDLGIGYPIDHYGNNYTNSLIRDFELPALDVKPKKASVLQEIISRKKEHIKEIRLEHEEAERKNTGNNFHPVFYTSFELVSIDQQSLPRLKYVGDRSGVKLLTRFSHMDPRIENLISDITRKEQELSKEILAEIVHLPGPRLGNISTRPHIRNYEITCLTFSDRETEHQIPLSDLMISVKNHKVILRSKKLNKVVKPVLSTAHNYTVSELSVYRFLCEVQFQDTKIISFPFEWDLPYTPRIRYKNVLLSLATWIIRTKELEKLFSIEDEDLLLREMKEWLNKKHIPEHFLLCIGDNELLIESGKTNHVRMFLKEIKNRKTVKIAEFLFDDQHSVVRDQEGNAYRQEIILPLYCSTP